MAVDELRHLQPYLDQTWVNYWIWRPYKEGPPVRSLVEVGHLDDQGRFVAERAHLMLDILDARHPKIEVPLNELPAERRAALRVEGSGAIRMLKSMGEDARRRHGL